MIRVLLTILMSSPLALSGALFTEDAWTVADSTTVTEAASTTSMPPPPTYPPLPDPVEGHTAKVNGPLLQRPTTSPPYVQIQSYGPYSVVPPGISTSCLNQYNIQFQRNVADQLNRAKGQMLSDPTFCPQTTDATLKVDYAFLNGNYNETDVFFVYSISPIGAETLSAISNCGWQLSAWMSSYSNWKLPIFSLIAGCPELRSIGDGFIQEDISWYCPN